MSTSSDTCASVRRCPAGHRSRPLRSYLEVYNIARAITGVGEGKGPFIAFHDGFTAQSVSIADGGWNGFLPGADRVSIDAHPYLCFDTPNNDGLAYQASKVRFLCICSASGS